MFRYASTTYSDCHGKFYSFHKYLKYMVVIFCDVLLLFSEDSQQAAILKAWYAHVFG